MKRNLIQMLVIGVIASAILIAAALAIDWFPAQASTQATEVDDLFDLLLIVSIPFFVLVEVVVLFCVWKFRMRPGEELKDGAPIHGNTRLEVVWTAIPTMLLVALCSYTYVVLKRMEEEPKGAKSMVVNVTGEQFAWTFEYPAEKPGGKPVSSTQLYLPKDRPVQFRVRSKDVIHDFWVPEFRMKIDAVPGITTSYRVTPTKLGTYPVVCAELCGLGHAAMRQNARVVSPSAFTTWMTKQAAGSTGPAPAGGGGGANSPAAGDLAADGRRIFTQAAQPTCGSCHTLSDAGTTATTGPNLDQSLKGKDAAYIRASILQPNAKLAQGFGPNIMPPTYDTTLSKQEIDALVAYLGKVAGK